MKPTVYIETTLPSYYCDDRPALVRDIARTQQWWDHERGMYECFISEVVLDESSEGNYPNQAECVEWVQGLRVLAIEQEVLDIADVYQKHRLMPRSPVRDAIHLALASYYRMDFLLTWNCRHLANVNKSRHLEILDVQMGLSVPKLVTPQVLQPLEDWQ